MHETIRTRTKMKKLLVKRWRTPDGTVLTSRHRHDFVSHKDKKTGLTYIVDGGLDYLRVFNQGSMINLCVYSDETFEVTREACEWGSRGITGKSPIEYTTISKMSEAHIEAVLLTQESMNEEFRKIMMLELEHRQYLNK